MNVERLTLLADRLEADDLKEGVGFNMGYVIIKLKEAQYMTRKPETNTIRECDTVACIAGHAALMFGDEQMIKSVQDDDWNNAGQLLGIDNELSNKLFYPFLVEGCWDQITRSDAAQVIRNLIETGKVDWSPINQKYNGSQLSI